MRNLLIFMVLCAAPYIYGESEQFLLTIKALVLEIDRLASTYLNSPMGKDLMEKKMQYNLKEVPDEEYDFIVVGAGSAGCVVANRLSEVGTWSVLILEAGIQESVFQQIPLFAPVFQDTMYDWAYVMEYEKTSSYALINRRMAWPRGKALGGTSTINYMIYTRGNKYDFDRWAAEGNPGWSYEEVLPYYIKSERARLKNRKYADYAYHGTKGYLSVEDSYQSPLVDTFIKGVGELGLPPTDYNSPTPILGAGTVQANMRRGRRNSAAQAFLRPIRNRKNLHVTISAFAHKILIDPETKRAYGVLYEKNGVMREVRAKKEVILSAGPLASPQLLMLSGIGPNQHLTEMGIPVVSDLPVGQNLHDHLCFPGTNFLIKNDISINAKKSLSPSSILEYLKNGTGYMSSLGGVEGIGYLKTEVARYIEDWPDIELIFVGGSLASDYGAATRRGMRIRDDVYNGIFRSTEKVPSWTIFPMLLHPKSTGFMKLRSVNPYDHPIFHGNFFTDPNNEDIKTFIAAIRFMQRLSDTKPFKRLGSRINPNPTPGCQHYPFDSDPYWECSLRSLAVTLHHQVGTCKMGPPGDPGAVVNNLLQVYGVGNLRVVDSGVIPFALSAHTNAPAIMVGEKASDIIKQQWNSL